MVVAFTSQCFLETVVSQSCYSIVRLLSLRDLFAASSSLQMLLLLSSFVVAVLLLSWLLSWVPSPSPLLMQLLVLCLASFLTLLS